MSEENNTTKSSKNQYHHLTEDERVKVQSLAEQKDENGKRLFNNTYIANYIGVDKSTISRELRNRINELAKNLGKLGNKNVANAITNIPQLATALNNLMETLSKAPTVSQNGIQMTNALANLSSQGNKVGSASNSIVKGLNRASNSTTRARKNFGGLASAIGKFYATYFLAIRGLKGLWSSIESTADYIEAFNYFNVALGKIGSDWSHQFEKYGYENAK